MARSRPFGLFILALCLVACVCAHAVVNRRKATKIVNEVQKSTNKALDNLNEEINNAIKMRYNAKTYKENAEKAAKEAEKAAQGNSKAMAIAETAKNASAEVLKLYPRAFALADKYLDSMIKLRPTAQELIKRARIELFVSEWREGDYTKTKEDADAFKAEAAAFRNKVQETMNTYSAMDGAQKEMPKFVSAAQLARHHVDVIVAVAKIETLLKSAENDIEIAEQKKDQINANEQEMKKLPDKSPENLINYISRLYFLVEDYASSALYELKKAKKAKTHLLEQKAQADEALVKVEAEKDVDNAESEADVARRAVKDAEEQNEVIKKTLESVTNSATEALRWKSSALNAISQQNNKSDVTQENDKMNSKDSKSTHQPVNGTTKIPVEIGAEKTTITATDKSTDKGSVIQTTEKSTGNETKQETKTSHVKPVSVKPQNDAKENDAGIKKKNHIITTEDQPVDKKHAYETTESTEENETKKPKITNSEQSVSEGKEPTKPFSIDSAMTVSVPLLLAMVACAALH